MVMALCTKKIPSNKTTVYIDHMSMCNEMAVNTNHFCTIHQLRSRRHQTRDREMNGETEKIDKRALYIKVIA